MSFTKQATWLLLVAVVLTGCFDCEGKMKDTRELWGLPTEIERFDSKGYHSETWWYWSRGQSFTFTWGTDVSSACDVSTYTFTPISFKKQLELEALTNRRARSTPGQKTG